MKKIFVPLAVVFILLSCEAIFVEDISNLQVEVLAPKEGSTINATNINFSWQTLPDATQYQIQIATPTFENAVQIVADTVLTTTSYAKNLDAGNYQWRVKASNSDYDTTYSTNSFTVQ